MSRSKENRGITHDCPCLKGRMVERSGRLLRKVFSCLLTAGLIRTDGTAEHIVEQRCIHREKMPHGTLLLVITANTIVVLMFLDMIGVPGYIQLYGIKLLVAMASLITDSHGEINGKLP